MVREQYDWMCSEPPVLIPGTTSTRSSQPARILVAQDTTLDDAPKGQESRLHLNGPQFPDAPWPLTHRLELNIPYGCAHCIPMYMATRTRHTQSSTDTWGRKTQRVSQDSQLSTKTACPVKH